MFVKAALTDKRELKARQMGT